MAPAGSQTGRREEVSLFDKVVENWELYHTLRADRDSMGEERIRLYELANAATGAERFRTLDQVQRLEQRINETSARMKELLTFVEENVEEARHEAQRSLSGSRRGEAMERLEEIQAGLIDIHAEEAEVRRVGEHIEAEILPGIAEAVAAAPQEAVPARAEEAPPEEMPAAAIGRVSPEYSASYRTMMRWYRRLLDLEEDNGRRMARLERDEREGNTRSANIQRKKIDENVEEMAQLMANISRSLSDAMAQTGENQRQTRELENILATWDERQQHLLDAMAARGEPPEAARASYEAAHYLCSNSMDDVLFMLTGQHHVAFGPGGTSAPPAPTQTRLPHPTPIPPQTAVVPVRPVAAGGPVEVPEGETYFEYVNQLNGRRYRISIRGEDLSGMSTEEVYARVRELVQDEGTSSRALLGNREESDEKGTGMLFIERINPDGSVYHRYINRGHLADAFFREQLGWTPGAVAPVAPPTVAERPPIAVEAPPAVAEAVPAPVAAPQMAVPPSYSTDYGTVMGWNRRLTQIESENKELMERAVRSRDTDIETEIENQFDTNVEEQAWLMASISLSLSDAIGASSGGNRRRLEGIMAGWPEVQARLLDLIDVRGSLRSYPEPLRSNIEYLCRNPMDVIAAGMPGAPYAPAAPTAVEAPPTVVEAVPAPITAPPAEAAHDATWARDMHSSIIGRFPALRDFVRERDAAREAGTEYERQAEMDLFLAELVRDYVTFRNEMPGIRDAMESQVRNTGIGLQVLEEMDRLEERMGRDGRRISEMAGMSARDLVAFAESYFAGIPAPAPLPPVPAAPEVAEVEPVAPPVRPQTPPVAPPAPTVAEAERPEVAPPVAAPQVAAPVEAAPALTQERAAELVFNYMKIFLNENEARRISEYVSGRRVFGSITFRDEETATRVFDRLNIYIQRFRLNPLVLAETEDGRLMLTDAPRPPRTDTIIEDLARDNMNFTEEVAAWATDAYNEAHPEFPVAVEGWFTPAEIFQRGRMIEILSSSLFRALRSMNDAMYRVDRGNGMETVDAYDFGAYFVFDHLGRHRVELSESEAMVGQFSNEDLQVLFSWVASCFTGNHENLYDNLMHAVDPSHQTADPNYSGMRISRANLAGYNRNFEEFMAALPSDELRAAIDYNAFIIGAMIRTYYVRQYGEPATEEAASQLDTACVNAGRVIMLGQMEAEMGRNWHQTFTYNGEEYMLGTHLLTRPSPESGIMIDGERRQHLLVLPTADPLEVRVVGYWERGRVHLLREGGGDAVANVRLEETPEGEAYIPHHVSGRDSLGNGLTPLWCYPSPGYRFGLAPSFPPISYDDIGPAPYIGLPSQYEDVSPPIFLEARTRLGYAVPELGGEAEHYTTGEVLDEAEFTISNPVLYYPDRTVAGPVSLDQMLENPYTLAEWGMFRVPRRGENVLYPTLSAQAAERYADYLQGDLMHTAEFREGIIYVYVDTTTGKVVDALDPDLREAEGHSVEKFAVGTYSFTFEGEMLSRHEISIVPGAEALNAGIPADVRGLILARATGRELFEMRETHSGVVTASGEGTITIGLQPADNVRSMIASDPELYPPDESYLAFAAVRAPMPVRAGTVMGAGAFDYTALAPSLTRLGEIRSEYMRLAAEAKVLESAEEERTTMTRMANLLIERREIYDGMLASVEAALPSYSGEQRAELERLRDGIVENRGWEIADLRAFIESTASETFYSRAYVQSKVKELGVIHDEFTRIRDRFYASTDVEEMDRLAAEGWALVLRRRETYEDILRHIDSVIVSEPEDLERLNAYRAGVEAGMEAYYPATEVDYDALRAERGR